MGSKSSPQFCGQINYLKKSCRGAPSVFSPTLCTLLGTNISPFCKGTLESKILPFPFGGMCHIVSLKVVFLLLHINCPLGSLLSLLKICHQLITPLGILLKKMHQPTHPAPPTTFHTTKKNNDETKKHRPASVVSRCSLAKSCHLSLHG